MIAIEVVVAYGSLPDTAKVVIPGFAQRLLLKLKLSKILSMIAIEVVVAYGSLPDPAEVVIPGFAQRLLLKLKLSKTLSMIAVEVVVTYWFSPRSCGGSNHPKIFSTIAVEVKVTQGSLTVPVEVVTTPGSFITA